MVEQQLYIGQRKKYIKVVRSGWNTVSPLTLPQQDNLQIRREFKTQGFSLRREGFEPHIMYPNFLRPEPEKKMS